MSFLQIDLRKLKNNYFSIKQRSDGAECYCVVKSDAYGCGLIRVAKALQDCGASGFVVADVEEGVALRQNGVVVPVVVLGYVNREQAEKALRYDLTLSVFNYEYLRELKCTVLGKRLKIWLKINCGFNRVGFDENSWRELIKNSDSLVGSFVVTGIFAHFRPFFSESERDNYICNFVWFCELAKKNPFFKTAKTSLFNSCGLRCGLSPFDVVRVGASLYGLGDGNENSGTLAEFYAKVLQINLLHKGQTVGYDDSFVAKEDCFVAILDVGYADGLPRNAALLGLRSFHSGEYLSLIGSVCMNHSFVLLNKKTSGLDFVELFGKNLSIKETAEKLGTIDYEVLCRFGKNSVKKYLS